MSLKEHLTQLQKKWLKLWKNYINQKIIDQVKYFIGIEEIRPNPSWKHCPQIASGSDTAKW